MEKVMIYPIVVFGAPVLREKCREIGPDYPEVKKLIEDMFLTLEEAEGVGLAAPQIGKSIRLFIVDCTPWGEDHPELADYRRAFINPEIYEVSEETKLYEEFTGLPAWVIQHEYDHLEGVVFTDRLSPLRRNLIKSKLMSLTKGRYKCSYKTK